MSSENPRPLTRSQRLAVGRRVLWDRAGGRCECRGDCGITHPEGQRRKKSERCTNVHGDVFAGGGRAFITLTFLNGNTEDCTEQNLLVMCNACRARALARTPAAPNPVVPKEQHG